MKKLTVILYFLGNFFIVACGMPSKQLSKANHSILDKSNTRGALWCAVRSTPTELRGLRPYQTVQVDSLNSKGSSIQIDIVDDMSDGFYNATIVASIEEPVNSPNTISGIILGKYPEVNQKGFEQIELLLDGNGKIHLKLKHSKASHVFDYYCEVSGDYQVSYQPDM
ncbi:MAG: hypothetical protein R3B45_15535 [Bdellovibrionota bacterium]